MSTIVPVPKKAKATELNDYCPVALNSVIMKCFERLVMDDITSSLPDTLDPLQFASNSIGIHLFCNASGVVSMFDSHRAAIKIIKDNNHPSHCLFTLLSSRRRGHFRGDR